MKIYHMPTGKICVDSFDKGELEFLSLGDYGRERNVKADFLGLRNDINGVQNGKPMPLEEKWVITISTQYGCSIGCKFCDVPRVGPGVNATFNDLSKQVVRALGLHPEIKKTKRLNLHYARMGEPTFNKSILPFTQALKHITHPFIGDSLVHPVISTMLPKNNKNLLNFLLNWANIKNFYYAGDAGLQLSINSTDNNQRNDIFNGNSLTIEEVAEIGDHLPAPNGRKYTLNFALSDKSIINADYLWELFDPEKFMVKITPMHVTDTANKNGIKLSDGYTTFAPYYSIEEELKSNGFDVLIFIPSYDEDFGMITCGNAVLSGKRPQIDHSLTIER